MSNDKPKTPRFSLRTCKTMPLLGCDKGLDCCVVLSRMKRGTVAKERLGNV